MTPARSGCWPSISEVDHRDLHVLAGRDAVRLDEAELGDDVLRRVALVRRARRCPGRARRCSSAAPKPARRSGSGMPAITARTSAPPVMRKRKTVRPSRSNRCVLMTSSPNWRCSASIWLRRKDEAELHHHFVAGEARLVERRHAARQRAEARRRHDVDRRPAGIAGASVPPPFWPDGPPDPPAVPGVLSLVLTTSSGFFSVNVSFVNCAAMLSSGASCGMLRVSTSWCWSGPVRLEQRAAADIAALSREQVSAGRSGSARQRIVLSDLRAGRAARASVHRAAGAAAVGRDRTDELEAVRELKRPVGADETADDAVGARRCVAARMRRVDIAEIHAGEAADEIARAAAGHVSARRGVHDLVDVDADETAEIAARGAADRAARDGVRDLGEAHAGEAADDAVRTCRGDVLVVAVEELLIVPKFPAAKPPRKLLLPPLTAPLACELVIVPLFPLTKPPAVPLLPTVTEPNAKLFEIDPLLSLLPTNPPALLTPVTLPNAWLPEIVPLIAAGESAGVAVHGRGRAPPCRSRSSS